MRRFRPLLLAALLAFSPAAHASPIVADISTYRIAIDAGFTGIRLFIFGARNESGDVVVVIRGPSKNFVMRKKEKLGGIWMNRKQFSFSDVPNFYAVATARPLESLQADALLKQLGIGSDRLIPVPSKARDRALYPEFSQAFLAYQERQRLYNEALPLSFMGETLFKTTIPFPDTISKGDYTAEIYLIQDGELVGMQSMPISVEKSGIDALVYELAHQYALLYGILAVGLALGAGWTAGKLFERV